MQNGAPPKVLVSAWAIPFNQPIGRFSFPLPHSPYKTINGGPSFRLQVNLRLQLQKTLRNPLCVPKSPERNLLLTPYLL